MSREQLLRSAEDHEKRSTRLRERFGLASTEHQERVTDWLLSTGAVPAAIAAVCLLVYLAISLILGS